MNWRLKAVLFDLDDTLLENDMTRFGPAYLELLSQAFAPLAATGEMLAALRKSIEAVMRHADPALTNEERFWRELSMQTGLPISTLRPHLDRFCAEDFPQLRALTRPRPEAREVVRQARRRGLKIALATNPMFPAAATAQRIEWAGLSDRDFDHVTVQDNSHACKPNPAYYLEILRAIGATPEQTWMVGDDWPLDMAPAIALGMKAYWIRNRGAAQPIGSPSPAAVGDWADFLAWWKSVTTDGTDDTDER